MIELNPKYQTALSVLAGAALAAALYVISIYNYLLFHIIVETLCILVGIGIFMLVWHSRRVIGNNYLILLGAAYFTIAGLGFIHTLGYRGMGIFKGYDEANIATQLWIATRYIEALTMVAAPLMIGYGKRVDFRALMSAYLVIGIILAALIFSGNFPASFVVGIGLTPFKIISEYLICVLFALGFLLLHRKRESFDPYIYKMLGFSIAANIGADVAFMLYADVYGVSNLTGHFLKLLAAYFIYKGLVRTGLENAYMLLFLDLKKSQEELKKSERFLHSVLESIQDGIGVLNRDLRVVQTNRAFRQIFNCNDKDTAGECAGLTHCEDRACDPGLAAKVLDTGRPMSCVIPLEREGKWLEVHAFPLEGSAAGEVAGVIEYVRDITGKKHDEEALRRMASIVDSSYDAIISLNIDGSVLTWNKAAERIFGYSESEAIGADLEVLLRCADNHSFDQIMENVQSGAGHGHFDALMGRRDGSSVYVSLLLSPLLDAEGEPCGITLIAHDVTERRRREHEISLNEARLNVLYAMTQMGPEYSLSEISDFILDKSVGLTESQIGFIGFASEDKKDLLIQTWSKGVMRECAMEQRPHAFPIDASGYCTMSMITKRPVIENNYESLNDRKGLPAGHLGVRRFMSVPIFDKSEVVGLAMVANKEDEYTDADMRNLTILTNGMLQHILGIKATSELARAKEAAEAMSRAKSDFLANISHELRTPLNSIIGFSEIMKEEIAGPLNAEQQAYAEDIHTSGKNLLGLINDVLDLSRMEAGGMELEVSGFKPASAIASAIALVKEKAYRKGVGVEAIKSESSEAYIEADERKLKQVLFNLLSNAVKFTPQGGQITIRCEPYDEITSYGSRMIRFSVTDTGIGIKQDDMGRLFTEFSQLDSPYLKRYGGVGLGLSVSRRLVEMHGGVISAVSESGSGSTFSFTIPVSRPRSAEVVGEA